MPRLTFHLIPHTHWDREWYLPRAAVAARLVPVLDDLIARLESEPGFRSFLLDGQTVLLEDYLRVRPAQRARVESLARGGRLQLGPWYVLADELIPSGESLIRNLLLGRHDAEALGGRSDVLYSPDAFGHPASWPALAAEFGLPYGVLWRGLGGEPGQARDLFRWRAPDGRAVLLYHLPPDGYEAGSCLMGDDAGLTDAWARLRAGLVARATTSHVAVPVGADHHAAPTDIERVRERLADLEPEADVRVSRLDEFLAAAALERDGDASAPAAELRGELRWSYGYTWTLQGVHATRAPLKRLHADAELRLERVAEPLAALAALRGADFRPALGDAWRTLIRSQFHDAIGGCTSDAVARRVRARTEDAATTAHEIARVSLDALVGNDPDLAREHPETTAPALVLWNPVPRARVGSVVVADLTWFRRDVLVGPPGSRRPREGAGARAAALVGGDGPIALQPLGGCTAYERMDAPRHYPDQDVVEVTRVAFRAPALAGFGLAVLAPVEPVGPSVGRVRIDGRRLENGLVAVEVARDGSVTLADLATGATFPGLLRLESSGDVGDAYTYAPPPRDRLRRPRGRPAVRRLASGPLVGALEVRTRLETETGRVDASMVLTLHAGSPALRCTLRLENGATDHRLRLRCPTGLPRGVALAGGAFAQIARPALEPGAGRYLRETPVATAPAQRYVARADRTRGLAILAPGFFEYELTDGGDLLVTLLRSVGELSRAELPTRPGHAGWPVPTPDAQCLGPDVLQLAVASVTARELGAGSVLPALWEDCFLPPLARWIRQAGPLDPAALDIRLEGEGLVFSALKPAEEGEGIVLRCWNARGVAVRGAWRFGRPVRRAVRVRADERVPAEQAIADAGHAVPIELGPHAILTLLVDLQPDLPPQGVPG